MKRVLPFLLLLVIQILHPSSRMASSAFAQGFGGTSSAFAQGSGATSAAPAWDVTFRGLTDAKNIGEYMRVMSARPHHLGSPYGKQNAEWILARFKEWGWDARIETYDVLFPTPKERVVEML